MYKKLILFTVLLGLLFQARAQELNCNVQVTAGPKVQIQDKTVLNDMQDAVFQFMNTRRWSNDTYRPEERIQCNVFITIDNIPQIGTYRAITKIESSRPVFGSGYSSPVFTFIDKTWEFEYTPGQPLIYSDNSFNSNLTSLLALYAYLMIGMDYDTFGKQGGSPYYTQAQNIVMSAQGQPYAGWNALGDTKSRNRARLVDNLLDPQHLPLREALYAYHRQGMDIFADNQEKARQVVIESLKNVKKVTQVKPGSELVRLFFEAKSDELTGIFTQGSPADKQAAYNLLSEIDPYNLQKYDAIMKGR